MVVRQATEMRKLKTMIVVMYVEVKRQIGELPQTDRASTLCRLKLHVLNRCTSARLTNISLKKTRKSQQVNDLEDKSKSLEM